MTSEESPSVIIPHTRFRAETMSFLENAYVKTKFFPNPDELTVVDRLFIRELICWLIKSDWTLMHYIMRNFLECLRWLEYDKSSYCEAARSHIQHEWLTMSRRGDFYKCIVYNYNVWTTHCLDKTSCHSQWWWFGGEARINQQKLHQCICMSHCAHSSSGSQPSYSQK